MPTNAPMAVDPAIWETLNAAMAVTPPPAPPPPPSVAQNVSEYVPLAPNVFENLASPFAELDEPVQISEYQENLDDYRIKYDHCFGILGGKLIRAVDFYQDEDYETRLYLNYQLFEEGNWSEDTSDISIVEDIDWTLPMLGAVNIDNTVAFLRRKHKQSSPTRYRKGFRFDILDMFEPSSKEFHIIGKELFRHDNSSQMKILDRLFFPQKYNVDEALDSVLSLDRLGSAFSENYYFTLSSSINSFLLWRRDVIIGVYSKTNNNFKITTDLFNNDLNTLGIKWEAA